MKLTFRCGFREVKPSAIGRPGSPTTSNRNPLRACAIRVYQPQVHIPSGGASSDIRNTFTVRREHRNANSDLWILLKGDLSALVSLQIENPYVAVPASVAKISNFLIVWTCTGSLYSTGLLRDSYSPPDILDWAISGRKLPDIKLSLHPSS